MYGLKVSSISTAEPVTVEELKTHLKIQTTAEDALLDTYITSSRQVCENICKRSLVDTEWELTVDSFYNTKIELPMAPLDTHSSCVTVTYTKTTGDSTTLATSVYAVEYRAEPGFIRLRYEQEWPSDVQGSEGAVRIVYRSGYTTTNKPPAAIRHWIKMRAGQMHEYRDPLITGTIQQELPNDYVDGLLDPYRLPSI